MYTALMITLREGIEAFLIVAITLAYLKKTGRPALAGAVYAGTGIALLVSWAASLAFAQAGNKPLWEGLLAFVTAVLVVTFTVHVLRTAKYMKRELEGRLEHVATSRWAWWGVFGFTVLAITREGMEVPCCLPVHSCRATCRTSSSARFWACWPRRPSRRSGDASAIG